VADCGFLVDYPALVRHRAEQRAAARIRRKRLWIALPAIALATLWAFSASPPFGLFVAAIGAGVVFFLALPGGTSVPAGDLAGTEGEVAVLERLKKLPDDYCLFNRVRLPDAQLPNGWREIDFIVTGPTGLWIVEVKNTPGHVYVQPDERHWPLARRAGCGSRPGWNAMDNPIGQVRAQREALARWMLQHAIVVEPRSIICLSHAEVAVENAEASPVPVRVRDGVVETIESAPVQALPAAAMEALARLRSERGAALAGAA
jgi:hypothetical protein